MEVTQTLKSLLVLELFLVLEPTGTTAPLKSGFFDTVTNSEKITFEWGLFRANLHTRDSSIYEESISDSVIPPW